MLFRQLSFCFICSDILLIQLITLMYINTKTPFDDFGEKHSYTIAWSTTRSIQSYNCRYHQRNKQIFYLLVFVPRNHNPSVINYGVKAFFLCLSRKTTTLSSSITFSKTTTPMIDQPKDDDTNQEQNDFNIFPITSTTQNSTQGVERIRYQHSSQADAKKCTTKQ